MVAQVRMMAVAMVVVLGLLLDSQACHLPRCGVMHSSGVVVVSNSKRLTV